MMPFDKYPAPDAWKKTRHYIDPRTGNKCRFSDFGARRGYGMKLQIMTGQRACAYCGLSLVGTLEHWFLLAVDHVVPEKQGDELRIPPAWIKDYRNTVLVCSACNTARNKWKFPHGTHAPDSFESFLELRDKTFRERKAAIDEAMIQERAFFEGLPWQQEPVR